MDGDAREIEWNNQIPISLISPIDVARGVEYRFNRNTFPTVIRIVSGVGKSFN